MGSQSPEDLAEEVAEMDYDQKIVFLRALAAKIRPKDVSSSLFKSSCYIGIASNWMKEAKEDESIR